MLPNLASAAFIIEEARAASADGDGEFHASSWTGISGRSMGRQSSARHGARSPIRLRSGSIAAAQEVRRCYSRARGRHDPSEMSVEERRKAVLAELDTAAFGVGGAEWPRSA
jgi:hypothetical protein